jgi:hypothetical protein
MASREETNYFHSTRHLNHLSQMRSQSVHLTLTPLEILVGMSRATARFKSSTPTLASTTRDADSQLLPPIQNMTILPSLAPRHWPKLGFRIRKAISKKTTKWNGIWITFAWIVKSQIHNGSQWTMEFSSASIVRGSIGAMVSRWVLWGVSRWTRLTLYIWRCSSMEVIVSFSSLYIFIT